MTQKTTHNINLVLDNRTTDRIGEEKIAAIISAVDDALGESYTNEIVDISSIFHILLIFNKAAFKMIRYGVLCYDRGNWVLDPKALKTKSVIGLKVYNARNSLGISAEKMAKSLGISDEKYLRKENGDEPFSEVEIKSIAAISGLDVDYFGEHDFSGIKAPDKIYIDDLNERLRIIEQSNKHNSADDAFAENEDVVRC